MEWQAARAAERRYWVVCILQACPPWPVGELRSGVSPLSLAPTSWPVRCLPTGTDYGRERPPGGSAGFVKTHTAPCPCHASEREVAPVRLGDFRAGVSVPATKAETGENTEDRWKRPCESHQGLFVNGPPTSFSHFAIGTERAFQLRTRERTAVSKPS